MKAKVIILCLLILVIGQELKAQNSFNITYNYGNLTSSDLNSFIKDGNSWRGWQFEYLRSLNPKLSVGIMSGYQGFYEKRGRATYTFENTSINAVTWRYFKSIPIQLTGKYYFIEEGIKPYLGLGLGISIAEQEVQFSDRLISDRETNFSMFGEGGVLFPVAYNWDAILNFKYNHGTFSPDDFDTSNFSYFTVGVGISFKL